MAESCGNIYKIPRRKAGYTQEQAAELLAVSITSLGDYETGARVPPNDVVERMINVYNVKDLAYEHLHETNILMARVVPELEPRGLVQAALRIYNRMERFRREGRLQQLMDIADDGMIDETERPTFDAILADITELIRSGMELAIFASE